MALAEEHSSKQMETPYEEGRSGGGGGDGGGLEERKSKMMCVIFVKSLNKGECDVCK